jgi:PAS domain S-box-containing protein
MSQIVTEVLSTPFAPPSRRPPPAKGSTAPRRPRWLLVLGSGLLLGGIAWAMVALAGSLGACLLSCASLTLLWLVASRLGLTGLRGGLGRLSTAGEAAEQRARDAEARLRECESRLRWLTEGMRGYAIIVLDPEGRILTWDRAAETMFGYPKRDVLGQSVSCLCLEEDVASGKAELDLKRALVTGGFEDRGWRLRQGGWKFWAHVVLTPMREEEGRLRGLLCLIRDISEHKQAEDALRSSRTLYRNLTETARDVVITFARDSAITSLNLAFDRTTGWARGTWVGQPFTALAHPDDRPRVADLLQCIADGDPTPVVELRIRLASGEHLAVELMATPQVQDGEVIGGLALVRDLTDRKKAEESLRATEEKLRQSQKMEAIGRLAGGIAHDFNNLLTVILGCADLLLLGTPEDSSRPYAQEILKAGERAAVLTRQLLAFSRKTVMQPRVLEVNALVGNFGKMLRRLIGEDVRLTTQLHPGPLPVKADPSQLEQVIMNLVVNARDAMPGGGAVTVETATALLDPETKLVSEEGRPHALLAVTDTGVGMDENVKSHVFEPFFTTKEQGKGTGLGLAMVYGIVQQSDGHIEVQSTPGRGTTFKVYLPLTAEEPTSVGSDDHATAPPYRGTETVLLVEDEEGVRSLARNALKLNGYTVLEAADGAKALALCESVRGTIDVLITDVVMPCLGGVDLARYVSQRYPQIKVLFMSGYPDRALIEGASVAGTAVHYLQKPFSAQELTACIRGLLDVQRETEVVRG